jgi:CheY-like chemotaxis protein
VRLPLLAAPPAPARVEHNDAASKPMARPCRVLVVDDIKDLADSLALLLRRMGHDVHIAYNGRAAIEASEMLQPELALLDIGLPEMSGYEIAQRIRKQAWGRSIYLVALTGWGQPEDKTRALELGFNRHMTKPVSFAEHEQLVAEAAKYTAAAADQPKLARTSS